MTFRIAILQFEPVRNNVDRNITAIEQQLSEIQADLIVLPEMANTGYLYASQAALEPFAEQSEGKGPFLSALRRLTGETGGVIVSGYAEKDKNSLFNSAIAISPNGILANYRKTHLFFAEKDLFLPGDSGFITFNWKSVSIGLMICFDWIFPESARTLALAGAQIIAHPANLVLPYCQAAMITRSIENRVFTATANRIGSEQLGETTMTFTGMSQITAPSGEVIYRAPKDKALLQVIEIEPELALNKNITERNNLFQDRRPDLYSL